MVKFETIGNRPAQVLPDEPVHQARARASVVEPTVTDVATDALPFPALADEGKLGIEAIHLGAGQRRGSQPPPGRLGAHDARLRRRSTGAAGRMDSRSASMSAAVKR